jgi:hypothetical protein
MSGGGCCMVVLGSVWCGSVCVNCWVGFVWGKGGAVVMAGEWRLLAGGIGTQAVGEPATILGEPFGTVSGTCNLMLCVLGGKFV